jgi:predicted transcriptional regulator
MARRPARGPTEAELEILQALWEKSSATVGQVNEVIGRLRPTGYTTTLKLMQIMTEKGLLVRDDAKRPHLYRPASSKEKTQRKLVKDLLNRAFDGSAAQLVLRALSTQEATPEELEKIRRVLDELEGEGE